MKRLSILVLVILALVVALTACAEPHVHSFNDGWCADATHHWLEANCEHENEDADVKFEHTFENGKCTECGYYSYYTVAVDAPANVTVSGDLTTKNGNDVTFTASVSETLVPRVVRALEQTGYRQIAVAGGVAANSRIRRDILNAAESLGAAVYLPPLSLCGDNAAMIGAQAYFEYQAGNTAGMELNAYATKSILGETL